MSNPSGNTMTATRPCCVRQDACLGQAGMSVLVNIYSLINGKERPPFYVGDRRKNLRRCENGFICMCTYNTCTEYVCSYVCTVQYIYAKSVS